MKINLKQTKFYFTEPIYGEAGHLRGVIFRHPFNMRRIHYGVFILKYFTDEALNFILEKYPLEIHPDGVK